MKQKRLLFWVVLILVVLPFSGAWKTREQKSQCAKCLATKTDSVTRVFGLTVWRSNFSEVVSADYERVFGQVCEHVYRGAGRGDGELVMSFMKARYHAVRTMFDAQRRTPDQKMAVQTMAVIDALVPPDLKKGQAEELPKVTLQTLLQLETYLERVRTVAEWRAVLAAAQGSFRDTTGLPKG